MERVRAFVAVKINEDTIKALGEIIGELKESHADVRWVHPENIHVTLKFLGNIETGKIDSIKQGLSRAAKGFSPFSLKVKGVGAIPNPRYPRVVYVGLTEENQNLKTLAAAVESELEFLGFAPEKREFLPHLTIGRVKSFRAKTMLMMKMREFHSREIGSILVEDFYLMKSELNPGGAIYLDIARIPLTEGGENE